MQVDPDKLIIMEGVFRPNGQKLPQLQLGQVGPVKMGVVLASPQQAEPFLRAGKAVSTEPFATLVLHSNQDLVTMLPHTKVTVPCTCSANHEPVLISATMVQMGGNAVQKFSREDVVVIDTHEVSTLKLLIFRDELVPGNHLPKHQFAMWSTTCHACDCALNPTAVAQPGMQHRKMILEIHCWMFGAANG